MKRVCCVCKKIFGHKPGIGETHGLCPKCEKDERENLVREMRVLPKILVDFGAIVENELKENGSALGS